MKNISLKILLSTISLIVSCEVAFAQKTAPSPTPTPERPRVIVALLNDARFAAPELGVDIFLKILESKKVSDPVWRKEILDEAFRMIDDVKYPIMLRPAYGAPRELNDTEAIILAAAYSGKLDQLSLKGRVITLLIEADRARAKQMIFQMGGDLGLKARSCEDVLTYSPEGFYPVVAKVAAAAFTEKEIAEGRRALFIAPWIENIESPTQILPAIDLVRQMQGSSAERQMLFNALSRSINRDFKDDRSFTNSLNWNLAGRIGKLTEGDPDPLKTELVAAYRSMLLKNLRGTRCTDNEIKKDQPLPDYIVGANKLWPEKPLTIEDMTASELKGTAKFTHLLKKSPAALKFRDEGIKVRGGKIVDKKIVNHDVTDVAWVAAVNDYIDRALAYEGTHDETESELLFFKTAMLGGMLSGVDPGELRNSIVRRYLRQLAGSPLQKTSFIQWRAWIQQLLHLAPESFYEIASEFPNPNFKAMIAAKRLGI